MPSPDVNAYVDLELVDLDAQALIDAALEAIAAKFPEWIPREGNTELVLLEALATEAAEEVYAINRLPDGLAEALLRLFGLERDQGAPPTADVRFILADTAGHTIPAGTTVRLDLGDGTDPVDLTTNTDLVIAPGATTGVVYATGVEPTLAANGQPVGRTLELVDAIPYIERVELASASAGGRLEEAGDTFLDRTIPRLSRLTTTLVRPADFEAFVAEDAGVARVKVLDLYNPADPASAPGRSPGYVAVAVASAGGGALSAGDKADLAARLRAAAHAGLVINVVDANVTTVDVTIRVLRYASADAVSVEAAVTAAVTAYLNPDAWAWSSPVRVNELIARADGATGVDTVLDVEVPVVDRVLAGHAALAKAGVITVIVEDPA